VRSILIAHAKARGRKELRCDCERASRASSRHAPQRQHHQLAAARLYLCDAFARGVERRENSECVEWSCALHAPAKREFRRPSEPSMRARPTSPLLARSTRAAHARTRRPRFSCNECGACGAHTSAHER
jgi:hypothetical protein